MGERPQRQSQAALEPSIRVLLARSQQRANLHLHEFDSRRENPLGKLGGALDYPAPATRRRLAGRQSLKPPIQKPTVGHRISRRPRSHRLAQDRIRSSWNVNWADLVSAAAATDIGCGSSTN